MKYRGGKAFGRRIHETTGDRVFNAVNLVVMLLICIVILYPIYFIVIASFSSPETVNGGKLMLVPQELYISGYKKIFSYAEIWTGYANSLLYTAVGTFIGIGLTIPAAYALSRRHMRGHKQIMFLFAFTMFFGGGLIPTYQLVRNLNLLNTMWALILPGAASVWNIIVARTFMQTNIPESLL